MTQDHQAALDLLTRLSTAASTMNDWQHSGRKVSPEQWSNLHSLTGEAAGLLKGQYENATPVDGYTAAYWDEDQSVLVAVRNADGQRVQCYAVEEGQDLGIQAPHLLVHGKKFFFGKELSEGEWETVSEHVSPVPDQAPENPYGLPTEGPAGAAQAASL